MIVTTTITINGKEYEKTFSDSGKYIERDGEKYSEAIDPVGTGRTYVESEELIEEIEGKEKSHA